MSHQFTVFTRSHNGLPLNTLAKAMRKRGLELVEQVTFQGCTRANNVRYLIEGHQSVNRELEAKGK